MRTAIRRLRKQAGLSQRSLAAQVGVHFTLISRVERGKAEAYPSLINRIAQVLEKDPTELLMERRK